MFKFFKKEIKPQTQQPKRTTSNNCNGCKNQNSCKYGFYTYDSIDKRQWSLWEKYIHLGIEENSSSVQHPERINELISKYTKQKEFTKADEPWLKEYLSFEESQLLSLKNVGKCGNAYIRYMRLGDSITSIKETLNRLKAL